jgi:hypothetical protein
MAILKDTRPKVLKLNELGTRPVKVSKMASTAKNQQNYTDPELRDKLKTDLKHSDKGGKSGQWSARKSQLLAQEYEKHGGEYKGEKSRSQKSLEKWTKEEWQTKDGDARARDGDETKRYLPKKACEQLSEAEKQDTDSKKREGSKKGEQYVENTRSAKDARKRAKE